MVQGGQQTDGHRTNRQVAVRNWHSVRTFVALTPFVFANPIAIWFAPRARVKSVALRHLCDFNVR